MDWGNLRLYQLIWKRTIASQMSDAKIEKTQIKIILDKSDEFFIANGEILKFDGFLKVYINDSDSSKFEGILPNLKNGDQVFLKEMIVNQKFTNPPYRYSEASLVKKLEELGIGRPSTYAPTISTIQNREYVKKGISEGKVREYIQIRLENNQINEERQVKILMEWPMEKQFEAITEFHMDRPEKLNQLLDFRNQIKSDTPKTS